MMGYFLDEQTLFKPQLQVSNVDIVDICCLEEKLQTLIKEKYPHQDTVSLAKCVYFRGTQYAKDMIISAGELSGLPEFYKILQILVVSENVYFFAGRLSSWFMEHYRSYQLDNSYTDLQLLDPEPLNDHHPLTAYCVAGKLMLTPHYVPAELRKIMALLLRVNINTKLIQKIKLSTLPESVKDLQDELKEKLGLEEEFTIQYEDPDFDNALCNLMDISELPTERAVLHLVWSDDSSAPQPQTPSQPQSPSDLGSISSLDTARLHSSDSPYSPSSVIWNYMRSTSHWPHPFPIPSFSYDIELKLRKGNEI
ncbi:uncharacterized protein LOC129457400 [Periophthalmus magnuspinnatus]|uniref:uncharacterized protein LOC129457400 n=1 Tax=Periophthalmus magnuspinnatus TaxID=409849 RepID=UPI00243634A7|nr:uncharacterized protein LOC129457400 [Periophthalmus magnuspinnatus]